MADRLRGDKRMGEETINTKNLLETISREGEKLPRSERRDFLKQGLLLAGGALAGATVANTARADGSCAQLEQVSRTGRINESLRASV